MKVELGCLELCCLVTHERGRHHICTARVAHRAEMALFLDTRKIANNHLTF